MKKNILIVVLSLITLSFVLYSFIKADEAEKAAAEAAHQRSIADELRARAEELQEHAILAAAEARKQESIANAYKAKAEACN